MIPPRDLTDAVKLVDRADFWSRYLPVTESGCWIWMGSIYPSGYGSYWIDKTTSCGAHRLAWTLTNGAIQDGLVIDHLCRVRACINPAHLEPVTQRENYLRSDARERSMAVNASITACPHGHKYTADNILIRIKRGYKCRRCKACERIRSTIKNRKRVFASMRLNRRLA